MRTKVLTICVLFAALFLQAQQPATNTANTQSAAAPKPQQQAPAKAVAKRVRTDLSGFELDKSRVQPATQIGGATRGTDAQTVLLAPRLGRAYDLRPVFRWQQRNKANSFTFRLMNSDGVQVYAGIASGTTFHYPQDAPPLRAGETYSWTVEPEVALLGTTSEAARFVVVGDGERDQIEKELAAGGASSERRAEIYVDHRLWYDSVESYTALIASHPGNAELYERRGELYEQIPSTQPLARSDLQEAEALSKHE